MKNLVIIGGGFAGLWSAFSAYRLSKQHNVDSELSISLINKDPYHGLRPRFYENDLSKTRIPLADYLNPINAELITQTVESIDHQTQKISFTDGASKAYDKLILATGSQLILPSIPGFNDFGFNIDTYAAAVKLKAHIESLPQKQGDGRFTIVVIGGSFTGVEAATDFMDRLNAIAGDKARVIVIDRGTLAHQFSAECQEVIHDVFTDMGIESVTNEEITEITATDIRLRSGESIPTQTVVWTAGIAANPLAKQFGLKLDKSGRLPVDNFLQVQGIENCFAAGDVANANTDGTHPSLLSCQHAMPQGRFAGNNAVASLFNLPLEKYEQLKFVTCLDLGSWGALYSEGWDQKVVSIKDEAKKIKLFINHDRIYPPTPDKGIDALLDAAEPAFKEIKT